LGVVIFSPVFVRIFLTESSDFSGQTEALESPILKGMEACS
jgi:hypothetical protein